MKILNKIRQVYDFNASMKFLRFSTLNRPMISVKTQTPFIGTHTASVSDDFLLRVQRCYQRAIETYSSNDKSMWHELESNNAGFIQALSSDDPSLLRPYLENLYAGNTLMGMGHVQSFVSGQKTIYPKKYFALRVRDAILSLAEALGISPLPSNQQTRWAKYIEYLNQDLAPLIIEIEKHLGHKISAPDIGHPPVIKIGDKLFNPDFIRHAYIMHRVKQLGIKEDANILEIGGGYGCVAYFAYLHGYRNYTIIDLPYVNAIQMLFLGATIGEENVSGYNEEKSRVHLLPSNAKSTLEKEHFNLTINMDSLPEIGAQEAIEYLSLIEKCTEMFFSINQEAQKQHRDIGEQNLVHDLVKQHTKSFKLSSRHRYWMEQGYAEEVYRR